MRTKNAPTKDFDSDYQALSEAMTRRRRPNMLPLTERGRWALDFALGVTAAVGVGVVLLLPSDGTVESQQDPSQVPDGQTEEVVPSDQSPAAKLQELMQRGGPDTDAELLEFDRLQKERVGEFGIDRDS